MRTADEILDDELSDNMVTYLKENPTFREWIKDAMFKYALEYHKQELKKEFENGNECDYCGNLHCQGSCEEY